MMLRGSSEIEIFDVQHSLISQGTYSNNKEMKFQYIPVWIELNFQDISDAVHNAFKRSDQCVLM